MTDDEIIARAEEIERRRAKMRTARGLLKADRLSIGASTDLDRHPSWSLDVSKINRGRLAVLVADALGLDVAEILEDTP